MSEGIKIGTVWCNLFGHKFIGTRSEYRNFEWYTVSFQSTYCVRCGCDRSGK